MTTWICVLPTRVDYFPFSIQSTILYDLLNAFTRSHIRSIVHSFKTRLSGQDYLCVRLRTATYWNALYRTFIPQSFIRGNNSFKRPGRWSHLEDGRRSGPHRTNRNTVRHTKSGRIRGMVVDEGGRSTGVLTSTVLLSCHKLNSEAYQWSSVTKIYWTLRISWKTTDTNHQKMVTHPMYAQWKRCNYWTIFRHFIEESDYWNVNMLHLIYCSWTKVPTVPPTTPHTQVWQSTGQSSHVAVDQLNRLAFNTHNIISTYVANKSF